LWKLNVQVPAQFAMLESIKKEMEADPENFDTNWDESNPAERAFKLAGKKRYRLTKTLLGSNERSEGTLESMSSSTFKDSKVNALNMIGDLQEPAPVQVKIEHPELTELLAQARVIKSADPKLTALIVAIKHQKHECDAVGKACAQGYSDKLKQSLQALEGLQDKVMGKLAQSAKFDKDKSGDLEAIKGLTADMVILQSELVSYMDAAKINQKKVKTYLAGL
jgi:hypothetical protein